MNENELILKEFFPDLQEEARLQFDGDPELGLFLTEWLSNGMNATQAYLTLHPGITPASARTLGCRKLAKVDISAILPSYDLSLEAFLKQLQEGLRAVRTDDQGHEMADHRVRQGYLHLQAKLLKLF